MESTSIIRYLALSCVLLPLLSQAAEVKSGKLLVILMDGFRWDYVSKQNLTLPNFQRLADLGAHAVSLKPEFPSLSIPNHYSLMTGLHTQKHGMTGNFMYDYRSKGKFMLLTTEEGKLEKWWDGGEPLWITAVKQNKTSSMYRWRGCEVNLSGWKATYCLPFTTNVREQDFDQSVADSFYKFRNNVTDIAGVYTDIVDITGHWYGPDAPQVSAALQSADRSVGKLLDLWTSATDDGIDVNVMIFSDHGMAEISTQRLINVTDILTPDLYETIMESGPVMSVYVPKEDKDKENEVLEKLRHFHPNMTCYRREELPARWQYAAGRYVAPVTCVADLGWFILHPLQPQLWMRASDGKLLEGEHGYDVNYKEMWAIFYGLGPAFIPRAKVDQVNAVDLYPVMCRLAGLKPLPYQGKGRHLNQLLQPGWRVNSSPTPTPFVALTTGAALTTALLLNRALLRVLF